MIFPSENQTIFHCNLMQASLGVIDHPEAAVVIHNTRSCSNIVWKASQILGEKYASVTKKATYKNVKNLFCTGLTNQDAIFGAGEKLRQCLKEIIEVIHPEIVFVACGCVPGVIGDDTNVVCYEVEKETDVPIILLPGSGFMVPGHIDTVTSMSRLLFERLTMSNSYAKDPKSCIIAGFSPAYSTKEEYEELLEFVHALGFSNIYCPPVGMKRRDWEKMASASGIISFVRGALQKDEAQKLAFDMSRQLQIPCLNLNTDSLPWKSKTMYEQAGKLFNRKSEMEQYSAYKIMQWKRLLSQMKNDLQGKTASIQIWTGREVLFALKIMKLLSVVGINIRYVYLSQRINGHERQKIQKLLLAYFPYVGLKHIKQYEKKEEVLISTCPFDLRKIKEIQAPRGMGYREWSIFLKELAESGNSSWN